MTAHEEAALMGRLNGQAPSVIAAAWVLDTLRQKDARIAELEARVAELEEARARRDDPATHGIAARGLTRTEFTLLVALLPPRRVVSGADLLRAAWPDYLAAEGDRTENLRHLLRVNMSRVRAKLDAQDWLVPFANGRGDYTLVKRGEELPPAYGMPRTGSYRARRLPVAVLRRALDAYARDGSATHAAAVAGCSPDVVRDLALGRHWSQKEGLLPTVAGRDAGGPNGARPPLARAAGQ